MHEDIDLAYYRKLLLARRDTITAGSEARRKDAKPVELDQTRVGRLSRMDALQQQAISQATTRRAELELKLITAALDRINSGEYGYCLMCEGEIAEGRLRVAPTTLLCISCAQKAEKR